MDALHFKEPFKSNNYLNKSWAISYVKNIFHAVTNSQAQMCKGDLFNIGSANDLDGFVVSDGPSDIVFVFDRSDHVVD